MFNDTLNVMNQITNFIRTPKNREHFKYFKSHPNADHTPPESQSDTDHQPSTDSNVNYSAKSNRRKENHDKYRRMKDKRRKRRDASDKTRNKSFWELNHMHFNIQDMSHVMMSLQSMLFKPDIPIAQPPNANADPLQVFNLNQTFDKRRHETHGLNTTQYQLRPQQYCYHCYKIITGLKRKTCTKCRLAPYCTKQCRKSNWKYHSYSCAKINRSELLHIANASSMECMDAIEDNMRHPTATLSLYLQRIHFILMHGASGEQLTRNDIGLELHALTRIYGATKALWLSYINVLWSCYGMPEFLLNTPMIRRKRYDLYQEYGFPPDYTQLSSELQTQWDSFYEFREENVNTNSGIHQLAFFIANMLGNTILNEGCIRAIRAPASSVWVFHRDRTQFQSLQAVRMRDLVCKRLVEIWSDIHVSDDCGDALGSISNVMEHWFNVKNRKEVIYDIIGCDFEYMVMNTTFIDCCVSDMKMGCNKRASTSVFEYIVEHITDTMLWKDKYIATYYILLMFDTMYEIRGTISELESDKNSAAIREKQVKLTRKCFTKILPRQFAYDKVYQLEYVSKCILLYHYQQPRSDTVDEWRITMPLYKSFIKLDERDTDNHYSFDYVSSNVFLWNFVYFFGRRYGVYEKWMKLQRDKEHERVLLIEAAFMTWEGMRYNDDVYKLAELEELQKQLSDNMLLMFVFSKCIKRNHKFKENYNFWMNLREDIKKKKKKKYNYINKVCANPICCETNVHDKNKIFNRCIGCRIYYCSRKCQKIHWKFGHKTCCNI
eukprot:973442_1